MHSFIMNAFISLKDKQNKKINQIKSHNNELNLDIEILQNKLSISENENSSDSMIQY